MVSARRIGALAVTLLPLAPGASASRRSRMTTMGNRYRWYAASHKLLIPLVW